MYFDLIYVFAYDIIIEKKKEKKKAQMVHFLTSAMEYSKFFLKFRTLSSNDDKSNESEKYVKNNFNFLAFTLSKNLC